MPDETNAYLNDVLETHRMNHIDELLTKYKTKRDEVKEALEKEFSSKIYNPINSGSYAKHTAINSKFDLDIIIPVKKGSFDTLEDMFCNVYCFLKKEYGSVAIIRKQKVSIGIQFYMNEDGDEINLDIVPGRELNEGQYSDDKNLNLYIDSTYGVLEEKTYIQTNIQAQIDHIKAKENERKIIRLLKIWKNSNNEKYKSFLLELLTIKAFDKSDISENLWEQLKAVMEYIRDKVTKEGFRLKDPGNSGNNVMDTLDSSQRNYLSNRMDNIIKRIEEHKDNIKTYFPINDEFEDEVSSGNYYRTKGSVAGASIPANNQRFG